MASIKLNGAISICEELAINYKVTERNENNPGQYGRIRILPNNEGMEYITITIALEEYNFSIGYIKDKLLVSGYYGRRWFTGNNLRALLQLVVGHPLQQVDGNGDLNWFFAGLE